MTTTPPLSVEAQAYWQREQERVGAGALLQTPRSVIAQKAFEAGFDRENPCAVPPAGWWCSREGGHEGPCAARPEPENANKAGGLWYKRWWSAQQEIARLNAALESLTDTKDMRAYIENDAILFEQFATNMRECWHGTGGLCEEGSASNDFRVWMNEAHNRARELRAAIRALPVDGEGVER